MAYQAGYQGSYGRAGSSYGATAATAAYGQPPAYGATGYKGSYGQPSAYAPQVHTAARAQYAYGRGAPQQALAAAPRPVRAASPAYSSYQHVAARGPKPQYMGVLPPAPLPPAPRTSSRQTAGDAAYSAAQALGDVLDMDANLHAMRSNEPAQQFLAYQAMGGDPTAQTFVDFEQAPAVAGDAERCCHCCVECFKCMCDPQTGCLCQCTGDACGLVGKLFTFLGKDVLCCCCTHGPCKCDSSSGSVGGGSCPSDCGKCDCLSSCSCPDCRGCSCPSDCGNCNGCDCPSGGGDCGGGGDCNCNC